MQSLKPVGLPPESLRSRSTNSSSSTGVRELAVPRGAHAVLALLHAARRRDLGRHLRARQHAAVARLRALAQLDLDHLDLGSVAFAAKRSLAETPVLVAAAEVARRDLPDQVAAVHAVVRADRALARVVREAALLRTAVQREDRVAGQGTEAHRRDVENARAVRLRAARRRAHGHAKVERRNLRRHQRVIDPLVARGALIELRTERPLVGIALRALIDDRALLARERRLLVVGSRGSTAGSRAG